MKHLEEKASFSHEDEESYEKSGEGKECLNEDIEDKRIC